MAKINILTPEVYNRIAAGEVVDRPYSVVKELTENALDAGATDIEIRIEKGGKSLISVTDNGCGIAPDDLERVFLPHATSKIATAADLESISTLGFRGEAVASISAVSNMRYTSRCAGGKCYTVSCSGGVSGPAEECAGGETGTAAEVTDLFFHTPVRLKFLKSDKAEEGDITACVNRFILSCPGVSFRYFADGRLVSQSFGEGEEAALAAVYGPGILKNVFRIDTVRRGIGIRGYISDQNFFKPNRSYQSVFLNGRHIVNSTISAAVTNAYASYTMKRQYPFYVLHISMPADSVDVNVHPNKTDVRFSDANAVYGCVYTVLSGALDGSPAALKYTTSFREEPPQETSPDTRQEMILEARLETPQETRQETTPRALPDRPRTSYAAEPEPFLPAADAAAPRSRAETEEDAEDGPARPGASAFPAEEPVARGGRQTRIDADSCTYKGNMFNTFLIYELGDCVYIVDQHAAHERLIFNRLNEKMERRKVVSQPMLLPYELSVTPDEAVFLEGVLPTLREIGFDISKTGEARFSVYAVPADLQFISLQEFFSDVLRDISGLRGIELKEVLRDRLAMMACKAAVKGGMSLTEEEVRSLIREMDGDTAMKCPHGRPAVVRMTKYEIEKMFKRIV